MTLGAAIGTATGILIGVSIAGIGAAAEGSLIGAVVGMVASAFHDTDKPKGFIRIGSDIKAVRDDLRKIGLTLTGAGLLGLALGADKMPVEVAVPLMCAGYFLWFAGILELQEDK
jgi:hypothetical protein